MMQSNALYEFDAVCLGCVGTTAVWKRYKPSMKNRYGPGLIISQGSLVEDGVFLPAAEVTIGTVQGLLALRDAIDEALRYDIPQSVKVTG